MENPIYLTETIASSMAFDDFVKLLVIPLSKYEGVVCHRDFASVFRCPPLCGGCR